MLNRVGDRTPPCGTPVLNCWGRDDALRCSVYPFLPLM